MKIVTGESQGRVANVILQGDVLERLRELPNCCVQSCCTSPPYWGLRNYGTTGQVWDGKRDCPHIWENAPPRRRRSPDDVVNLESKQATSAGTQHELPTTNFCQICGAWRGELGLEPTPELYVRHIVRIFREVKRVLRDDGTLWLNIASSYSSMYIESERYILRDDLTKEQHGAVFKALSGMWTTDAQAKPEMPQMLAEGAPEAGELHHEELSGLRKIIHKTHRSEGEILLKNLCAKRKPNEEKVNSDSPVHDVRQEIRQVQVGDAEVEGEESLLQSELLVSVQPEGQSLSLDGRPARTDESQRNDLEKSGNQKGQRILPNLSQSEEVRSASHPAIRDTQEGPVVGGEWNNPLSRLPRKDKTQGAGELGDVDLHRFDPRCGLALNKSAIPSNIIHFFKPEYILKPKDDCSIPSRLSLALQADGWYLRSDIIWSKPNPMPESVTDRPTKAHEYIFLLTKSARYYYDAEAIKDESVDPVGSARRYQSAFGGEKTAALKESGFGNTHISGIREFPGSRNRRTVWVVNTQPRKEAHLATFPDKIPEICIKAGTSQKGQCSKCGSPWERVLEKETNYQLRKLAGAEYNRDGQYQRSKVTSRAHPLGDFHDLGSNSTTIGWQPTCKCKGEIVPQIVLDPFAGSGTTLEVAKRLGRDYIGIELLPKYVKDLIEPRLGQINPLWQEQ